MQRPASYKTKQSEAILGYIASLGGSHVTAAQIAAHFSAQQRPIGRATIYRHLEKLVAGGQVRRYTTDGLAGACYQYTGGGQDCHKHLHLKCESCGVIQHLDCGMLGEIERHILSEHDFEMNALKTVLYGRCKACCKAP